MQVFETQARLRRIITGADACLARIEQRERVARRIARLKLLS